MKGEIALDGTMTQHPYNKPTVEFISKQPEPVAALTVAKGDAESWLGRELTTDEWSDLCRSIEKYGFDYPCSIIADNLGELL